MPSYDGSSFSPPAPLARVTLRNPDTGATMSDTAMLLDSGADVTLVPSTCIERLALAIDPGEGYELTGFNGRSSIARAATLDLVVLKWTFKGRYLLIDQEWGFIGRDILNHLTLVFDGPRLTWGELK